MYYWLRHKSQIVMRAHFCGEGRRGWASAGLTSLTVYAVPSAQRQATEAALVSEVLPQMVRWLKGLELSGNVRPEWISISWHRGKRGPRRSRHGQADRRRPRGHDGFLQDSSSLVCAR